MDPIRLKFPLLERERVRIGVRRWTGQHTLCKRWWQGFGHETMSSVGKRKGKEKKGGREQCGGRWPGFSPPHTSTSPTVIISTPFIISQSPKLHILYDLQNDKQH